MDVNGLRISDEFRMRSPVVWLSLVIVVLCAVSAESGVQPSFHLIHGQAGPIFRSLIPVNGYRNVIPQYIGRRVEPQHDDDYDDEEDEDEEEEDDEEYDPGYGYGGGGGGGGGGSESYPDDDEDEDDDEEDDDGDDDDDGDGRALDDIEGRQAYVNNHYVDQPYVPRQDNRVKQQNQNNNRRPTQGNQNRPISNNVNNINSNQQPVRPNRRRPTPGPNAVHPAQQQVALPQRQPQPVVPNRRQHQPQPQQINVPPKTNRAPVNNLPVDTNTKQKLQLRPVATSTQFIATPVADLILRLSISIAKPVGHGNSTMFNVPIRIHQAAAKEGQNHVINLGTSRDDAEMSKAENIPVTSERLPVEPEKLREEEVEADDDDEEEEEKDLTPAAVVAVTEKQRK